jgi:hypothetical protein
MNLSGLEQRSFEKNNNSTIGENMSKVFSASMSPIIPEK